MFPSVLPASLELSNQPFSSETLLPFSDESANPEPQVFYPVGEAFTYSSSVYDSVSGVWEPVTWEITAKLEKPASYTYTTYNSDETKEEKEYKSKNGSYYVVIIEAVNKGNEQQSLDQYFRSFGLITIDGKKYSATEYELVNFYQNKLGTNYYSSVDINPDQKATYIMGFDVPVQNYNFCKSSTEGLCIVGIE